MTAGFYPTYQPQYQSYNQGYSQSYSQNYNAPQPAAQPQTYTTQAYTQNPMPAAQPQTQMQQGYSYPQTPGIVNYVTPQQSMPQGPQGQQWQTGLNSAAAQNAYQTQTQYPTQMPTQGQPLSHIPYEQNPLNMNSGFSPQNGMQNPINNGMNAQMPAPNVQGQGTAMNAQEPVAQPFIDIGVVNAPENYSKTPIIDDLNRRGQTIERETPPKLRNKKALTLGGASAACSMGALGIILTMALCKVLKLIKHK